MQDRDGIDPYAAERRLERSVDSVLRIIEAARTERQAPPVRAARQCLGKAYGMSRLARAKERLALT